jgi:hypothetical protein
MITKKDIEEANRKFEKLFRHTEKMPYPPAINESIAISTSMAIKGNAIIREVAKWKGDLEPLIRHGYLLEKIRSLIADYNAMAHDHKIVFGKAPFIDKFEMKMEKQPPELLTPNMIKRTNESVFRNIRLDHKDNKLKKVV